MTRREFEKWAKAQGLDVAIWNSWSRENICVWWPRKRGTLTDSIVFSSDKRRLFPKRERRAIARCIAEIAGVEPPEGE